MSLILLAALGALSFALSPAAQEILPRPEPPFQGKVGWTVKDSKADFPKGVEAPTGTPKVLQILTDDVAFGASSPFGGPIQTPNFERIANARLRYNAFHTTALCSPTRAALITGRNHQSAGTVGQVLRYYGYNTSWFGKMQNVAGWARLRKERFSPFLIRGKSSSTLKRRF